MDQLKLVIAKRQGLVGGLVGGILGNGQQNSGPSSNNDPLGLGGVTSVVSGLLPGSPSPSATASLTTSSPSSTASTTNSALSSATPTTATSTNTSAPPSSTSSSSTSAGTFTTDSAGSIVTITSVANASASTTASAPPKAFLANKPLEGGVFTLVGLAGLALIIVIATYAMRKSRRNRLDREFNEAVSFDPVTSDHYSNEMEKGAQLERYRSSGSSSGHGSAGGYNASYPAAIPRGAPYAQQGFYNNGQGYPHAPPYAGRLAPYGSANPPSLPQLNVIAAPPTALLEGPLPAIPRRSSLLDSPPTSPSDEAARAPVGRRASSHIKELDPGAPKMPVAAPLPATFGTTELPFDAYGAPRALKVTND